jgi:hypothetical protein
MTHTLDADDFFIQQVQLHCAQAGLSFFLVEPLWVEAFLAHLERGRLWPRVLLNMHSEHHQPEEIYHRLVRLAAARGSFVIDPPDVALAAFDKGRLHARLIGAGLHVPHTVVVPEGQVRSFTLDEGERTALGEPFVIKPALGYGRRGLVLDARSEADLARSVAAWGPGDFLLQRRIVPRDLEGTPAYWRVYFVFGSVWSCWWNCFTDRYRQVTAQEAATHNLGVLEDIIRRMATLTGMNFFSSEIALSEDGHFVVIDYVNDQCHMLSQSADPARGVPDNVVAAIAQRLVEAARERIRGR